MPVEMTAMATQQNADIASSMLPGGNEQPLHTQLRNSGLWYVITTYLSPSRSLSLNEEL